MADSNRQIDERGDQNFREKSEKRKNSFFIEMVVLLK